MQTTEVYNQTFGKSDGSFRFTNIPISLDPAPTPYGGNPTYNVRFYFTKGVDHYGGAEVYLIGEDCDIYGNTTVNTGNIERYVFNNGFPILEPSWFVQGGQIMQVIDPSSSPGYSTNYEVDINFFEPGEKDVGFKEGNTIMGFKKVTVNYPPDSLRIQGPSMAIQGQEITYTFDNGTNFAPRWINDGFYQLVDTWNIGTAYFIKLKWLFKDVHSLILLEDSPERFIDERHVNVLPAEIEGEINPHSGSLHRYVYDRGSLINSPSWEITGGEIINSINPSNGNTLYEVDVNWTDVGNQQIKIMSGSSELRRKEIDISPVPEYLKIKGPLAVHLKRVATYYITDVSINPQWQTNGVILKEWTEDNGHYVNILFNTAGNNTVSIQDKNTQNILNKIEVNILPHADPDDDFDRNWSMVRHFDEEENMVGASKQFYDVLGRPTQTQIKTLANQNVVAVQQIYDAYGAAVLSTLPAPINNQAFNYKEAFIANPIGNEYSLLDFDIPNYMNNPGEVNFPKPVGKTEQGSLGWYYSDNNFLEPLVATTDYPYSRRVEIKGPKAEVVQYSAPGDIYKTGSGYEGKNKRLKADLGEIQHYFDLRHHFIPNSTANLESAIYKNISVDLGGHETIQYTDAGGRAIVSAIGGGMVRNITKTPSELDNTFHIPEGISNASITIEVQGSSGSIFDLINKKNISYFPMTPGQYAIAPGFYETNRISSITYPTNYQNYSYNYYNDIGQLVATVAPEGVKLNSTAYPSFVTTYAYDQLGRMIAVTSPDEGTSQYVYSLDGKIRFSQNEEQRNSTPPRFSYTNYDNIGRLVESGEYTMSGTGHYIFEPHSAVTGNTKSVHTIVDNTGAAGALDAARCSDVTKMHYDLQAPDFVPDGLHPKQDYLYNQVAKTENENTKTWYSYDEFGQLEWMKQEIAGLGTKTIDYTYDFGGNVLEVAFQKGEGDAFYHHYAYDADQRLHQVFTSKDGETKQLQATYSYYLHGPLKRVELAEGLQGIDYVYTITGALKAINHADPARDPGQDGTGAEHGDVGDDVFGMTLSYHDGDYVGAGYDVGEMTVPNHDDQYGGAIKAISWHNGTETGASRTYAYAYDEKYQLLNASWGEMTGTGAYSFAKDPGSAHQVLIPGYDKHGNIQNLLRKGNVGNMLGIYAYNYQAGTNRLTGINHQGTPLVSYGYDAIGRTIAQTEAGNTMHLAYDAYGMVKTVKDQSDNLKVRFLYDDRGMRLCKETHDATGALALKTWYVRDAAGNVMGIYEEDVSAALPAALAEVPIYGASRLAVYKPQMQTTFYEIKDHLGSVRAVIGTTETAHYMATMEAPAESGGAADFPNYHGAKKISADMYNHTAVPGANRSIRLSGMEGEVVGLAKSLKVYPGDTIGMEVYGKYFAPTNRNTTAVGDMAAALAGAFELVPNTLEALPAYNAINTLFQPGPLLGAADWEDEMAPKAFINYILFDDDFIPYDFGFDQIDVGALEDGSGVPHDLMSVEAVAARPGYIYIYLSNESDRVVDVYFDDMMVTHTYSPIVAGADYYPFGLPMEGREVAQEDWRWGYQGAFAEEDEETGYSAFALRMYDARFGRWTSTDPYGQYWSPYVGMGNMPQTGVDPDGGLFGLSTGLSIAAGAGIGFAVGSGVGLLVDGGNWWKYGLGGAVIGGAVGGVTGNDFTHGSKVKMLDPATGKKFDTFSRSRLGKLKYPSGNYNLTKTFKIFDFVNETGEFITQNYGSVFRFGANVANVSFGFNSNATDYNFELFRNNRFLSEYQIGFFDYPNPTPHYLNNGIFNIQTEALFAPATFNLGLKPGDDGFIYSEGNKIGEVTLNVNAKLNHTQKMIWRAMGWR